MGSKHTLRVGAIALIVFALAGCVWFALETAAPRLGFDDTDSPAVSLRFLRAYPAIYEQAGLALFTMAIALTVSIFAVWDVLAARVGTLTLRTTSTFGLMAAAAFFMHGVLRFSVQPLLYIDELDHDWGEAAYLVLQMVGIHGFAQAGIFALCLWAVGLSAIGARTRTLPLALCIVGIMPAFRIAGLFLGPLGLLGSLSDGLWVVSMLAIPGVMLWCLILGLVFLLRSREAPATQARDRLPA